MPDECAGRRGRFPGLGMKAVAFLWGAAEATLFFVVPDVLLTWAAISLPRVAWRATFWALFGALLGGAVMYAWGDGSPESALTALDRVPGIDSLMIAKVEAQLRERGAVSLFLGPLTGTPYKIYAVKSGEIHLSFLLFLAVSVPARWLRFAALTGGVILLRRWTWRVRDRVCRIMHVVGWGAFYLAYFSALS